MNIICKFVDYNRTKNQTQPRASRSRNFPDRAWFLATLVFTFSSWIGILQAQEENVSETQVDIAYKQTGDAQVDESPVINEEAVSDPAELPVTDEQATNPIEEFVAREDAVNYYLDAIDDAEAANGAYSTNLAELYQGLGNSMLEQQNLEDAKEAFQQVIQIVRVNYGLDSPLQTDYLFQVANIEHITGENEAVDELLDTIYSINAEHYGKLDPDMLPVLRQLLAWYEKNRPMDTEPFNYSDIKQTSQLYFQIAMITELDKGLGNPETTAIYRDIGQTQWHIVKLLLGIDSLIQSRNSLAQDSASGAVFANAHARVAKEAFSKVVVSVARDPESSFLEVAEALAQLGDWDLVSGKSNSAAETYEAAYQIIVQNSDSIALADEYFSQPVLVRFMNRQLIPVGQDPPNAILNSNPVARPLSNSLQAVASQERELTSPATLEEGEAVTDSQALAVPMADYAGLPNQNQVINMALTITKAGRPIKVNVVNHPPQLTDDFVRRVKKQLSGTWFRPRLENGIPVKAKNFTWNILLEDTK